MKDKPKILILIVNWNNYPDTRECLDSLVKLEYENYQIIIVDNGSSDGSNELIRENFPDIILLEAKENLGFAGGNNIGIKYALENDFQYILLLNNDTEIINGNFLDVLVEEISKDPLIGAVGPMVLKTDGDPEVTILPYPTLTKTMRNTLGLYHPDLNFRQLVDSITGCCVLVRSEAFQIAGFLDENFFMYGEETEWFFRLRKAGWKVVYHPIESIIHKGGASSIRLEKKSVYIERRTNVIYTLVKHQQRIQAAFTIIFMLILLSLRILSSKLKSNQNERLPISMVLDLFTAFRSKWRLAERIGKNQGLKPS